MTRKVLVIGGGPGGSTAATLLARAGVSVTLLERDTFPRYHIGESIASSCRSILDFGGALEKIEERGYTVKTGVLLRWGQEKDWKIDWSELFGPDVRSWQVDRDDFDTILLDHAAEQGVEVIQGASVKRVIFDGDRAVGAEWTDPQDRGTVHTGEFDFVVDASGRAGVIGGQHFKNRRPHEVFRNVAIWGYWKGGDLLPGTPSGGINVVSSPDGWYWIIPLRDDRYSVGFVSHQSRFLERRADYSSTEEMLHALIAESATVTDLLAGGEFQPGVRVEKDFSYVADSFCGPGYFLVGDAACFLDPLLSTGVHLAMYSGMLSAASILSTINGDVDESQALGFYESLFRNAYQRLFTLVSGVYQQYMGSDTYFDLAESLVRESSDGTTAGDGKDAAFGELVAGVTDLREASDVAGLGTAPIQTMIDEAGHDGTPVGQLLSAAEQARQAAIAASPNAPISMAPMKMDATDLYDAASGLYLTTTPTLGIRRATADAVVA
ncbi:NAD(P)/FAD-dependent oxidoreductase [Streptomyces mangrovisoli]|uniref:Halogenase n=1 Tax=Streptomyces mangrovisoli TaxID=1428628 RepID=A0A1J4P403_9ACTN|nr:NAD(P)/FAD-dependent oxidoreductase [Streptomyces mangrovisoli]OIJ68197.1 halogenase [Streptomyces mangrovisoli]